jgi:hypothetical protein
VRGRLDLDVGDVVVGGLGLGLDGKQNGLGPRVRLVGPVGLPARRRAAPVLEGDVRGASRRPIGSCLVGAAAVGDRLIEDGSQRLYDRDQPLAPGRHLGPQALDVGGQFGLPALEGGDLHRHSRPLDVAGLARLGARRGQHLGGA